MNPRDFSKLKIKNQKEKEEIFKIKWQTND